MSEFGWVTMHAPILVWDWESAPKEYKALSEHGGDEKWVAFISDKFLTRYGRMIAWMDDDTPFAPYGVSEHKVAGGIIRIGA